jgi:hypothetical protein
MLTLRIEDPLSGVEVEVDVSGEENVFVCGGHGAEEEMLLHDVHRGFVHFFVLVGEAAKEDVHLGTLAWHPLGIVEKDGLHGSGPRRASGASSACDLCFMGASPQTPQPRCARESRRNERLHSGKDIPLGNTRRENLPLHQW